ncbi:hypothetical protein [Deinococcus saxicola]|uniref:hypothetical protein n=1 Tax=Deinococcus saxicola TaxID=249406 RepID=UPI003D135A1C
MVCDRVRGFDLRLSGGLKLLPELGARDTWRVCRELRCWHQPALTFTVWQGPDRKATEFSIWAPQGPGRKPGPRHPAARRPGHRVA